MNSISTGGRTGEEASRYLPKDEVLRPVGIVYHVNRDVPFIRRLKPNSQGTNACGGENPIPIYTNPFRSPCNSCDSTNILHPVSVPHPRSTTNNQIQTMDELSIESSQAVADFADTMRPYGGSLNWDELVASLQR